MTRTCTEGKKVNARDLLVTVDLDLVKEKTNDIIIPIPIVITNADIIERV